MQTNPELAMIFLEAFKKYDKVSEAHFKYLRGFCNYFIDSKKDNDKKEVDKIVREHLNMNN
jgi:hypothetical protein